MKYGIDASALVKQKTGVGNYIYSILSELVKYSQHDFYLYSNQEIVFPVSKNIHFRVSKPYRKGPLWQNTQLRSMVIEDAIDVFWAGNGYLPLGLPAEMGTVLTVHDLVYRQAGATMPWFSRWSRRIFQPLSVKLANSVVAVSQATAAEMERYYHRAPDVVIHPQIDPVYGLVDLAEQSAVRYKYDLNDTFLLVIGTLEPRKNLENLVQAWLMLEEAGVKTPLLAIAGGKGWLDGKLAKLVSVGESKGIIKKLGFVAQEDMRGLYAAADCFILPSLYEGFGMPALEAQLCGTPIMVSDIPSLREASGGIACFFEPNLNGIKKALGDYLSQCQPLVCRLPNTVSNDPQLACMQMMHLFNKSIKRDK
ncbi:glycosyl transferase family 1 [Aeromonas caviae]|uniref:glycosyltransferase family 4 protein n=1 Tax=Aeromonas caviae TaxID=648 RepID=UPI00191ED0E8|nr:glycosyltransferase family 1 protein [Aeromonas caviae]MBL0559083.1 glycosyltransferase family 4 protein [Aeromonas caviae]MDY7799419.1 glycosyltransferase family 1 protein [Aeromonas caviae]GJC01753.1 glycosyl transferase family 1 [Aeromonas caviae]GKQ68311.1 glycosyl transferase family 1 [Aeromonas caviae]